MMIRTTCSIALIGALMLSACQNGNGNSKETTTQAAPTAAPATAVDVPYEIARNYFVKNTVKPEDPVNGKIDSREKFENLFGAAATMGENGKPTAIDFNKQYVIAVTGPETDTATEMKAFSLKKEHGEIVFAYELIKGNKQSFTIRPSLIIIVDKTNEGKVVLKEISK